jgi:hypothetical protein
MAADTPLFLHEIIDVVGLGAWPYMEHTVQAQGNEKVNFELIGTFYLMGITGRWPQVVNLWEVPGGWSGWETAVDRLNLKRKANTDLEGWWRTAYEYRTGGVDRLLAGAPGCPTLAELVAQRVDAPLFVHELTEVRAGAATEYLAATRELRAPAMEAHGHRLIGLYEVLLTDTEVCTVWATNPASHASWIRAEHECADADVRSWQSLRRQLATRWREELMTPCPGMPIGPTSYEADD